MTRIDQTLTALAAAQHGLITRQQALHHGLGRTQVQRRLASGRWELVGRGVFRVAGTPTTPLQVAFAACLAAPDGARVSYLSAAAILGIWHAWPPIPHLTVPFGRSARLATAVVHRARLGPTDGIEVQGIPITSPARTLVDCASVLGPRQLQRLVDTTFHERLVTVPAVEHAWDQARLRPGRAGEVKLRAALEAWSDGITPGSPAEVRLRRTLVQWGFPEPALQVDIVGPDGKVVARADAGWAERKIGIEYDSERYHGPDRWAHDEARHRAVSALGWQLLHADKTDLLPGERSLRDSLALAWSATAA